MSSFKVFEIAGSALSAQSVRMNTVASNLANANTVSGDKDKVYKPRFPVFQSVAQENLRPAEGSAAVKVSEVIESGATSRVIRSPTPTAMSTSPTSTRWSRWST